MSQKNARWVILGVLGAILVLAVGCGTTEPTALPSPSPTPSIAPTPEPVAYIPQAIATQGGSNNNITDVNAGETFKTTITSVACVSAGIAVDCPIFGGYSWRQTNVPEGFCGEAGSVDAKSDSWVCLNATFPASAEFEGCVKDFDSKVLGCASVKVRVH